MAHTQGIPAPAHGFTPNLLRNQTSTRRESSIAQVSSRCSPSGRETPDLLKDYRGLFWRRLALALDFTAMLLSLAGIPVTAGFIGKFLHHFGGRLRGSLGAHSDSRDDERHRAVLLLANCCDVVRTTGCQRPAHVPIPRRAPAAILVLAALTVILVWLGVYPAPLLVAIRAAISSIV